MKLLKVYREAIIFRGHIFVAFKVANFAKNTGKVRPDDDVSFRLKRLREQYFQVS